MSKSWPKVIRDPVHNIIPFEDTECDRLLLDLINTKEFQRLRRIKQLGMSELVFPGANHSRFAHSIGVMHVARRIMDRVERLCGKPKIRSDQRIAVLAASLLHDVGHGPFSHAFEKVTGQKHEARTLEIICSSRTEIGKRLRVHDAQLPYRIAVFFDETVNDKKRKAAQIPEFLTQVVTSQLDADRFDYLLRDSYATGTDYGRFDLDWIVLQIMLDQNRRRFFVGRKAIDAAEAYIFARYHMYRSVYFHKTVRAAEVMARLSLKRFKALVYVADTKAKKKKIVPDVSPAVFGAFATETIPLESYLALDDLEMTQFFKACAGANDPLLKSLGMGLIQRKLYKAVDVSGSDPAQIVDFGGKSKDFIKKKKLDPEYAFVDDTVADTPYRPYDPDAEKPESQVYVESHGGSPTEISERSKALKALREEYKLTRYYFPESVRDDIERIASETLQEARD